MKVMDPQKRHLKKLKRLQNKRKEKLKKRNKSKGETEKLKNKKRDVDRTAEKVAAEACCEDDTEKLGQDHDDGIDFERIGLYLFAFNELIVLNDKGLYNITQSQICYKIEHLVIGPVLKIA